MAVKNPHVARALVPDAETSLGSSPPPVRAPFRTWLVWTIAQCLEEIEDDARIEYGEKGKLTAGARVQARLKILELRDRLEALDAETKAESEAERNIAALTAQVSSLTRSLEAAKARADQAELTSRRATQALMALDAHRPTVDA